MADHLDRLPSEIELLAAEHPEADIWRAVGDDGTHGDWIAELYLRLQSPTSSALGSLLAWLMAVLGHPPDAPGGTVACRRPPTDTPDAAVMAPAAREAHMLAPADSGRAELDRALVGLWGALEEARLRLIDLLAHGSLFAGRDHPRMRLSEYGRTLTYLQRGIAELRRGVGGQGGGQGADGRAANGAASG